MGNIYLLKDLARISGQSTHTIKFYLKLGILKEVGRGPETNFRYFDDSTLARLRNIRALRTKGISLKDIKKKLDKDELL
jgi:DNA-binding transcriptional MerR regulator